MFRLFIPIYFLVLLYSLLAEDISDTLVLLLQPEALQEDTIGDFSGAFYAAERLLLTTPKAQWPELLQNLSSVNIPAGVAPLERWPLSSEAYRRLQAGDIYYDDSSDIIYKRLGDSDSTVFFGPVAQVDEYVVANVVASLSGTVLLGLVIVVWTFTVQRRIRILKLANQRFGEGNLDTRVSEHPRLRLSSLNRSFNRMAEHIQQLADSHKHLSNAVAHELRTPLAHMRFELEFLRGEEATSPEWLSEAKVREASYLSLEDDITRLEALIEEMLLYARYDRKNLQVTRQRTDIQRWLQDYVAELSLAGDVQLQFCNLAVSQEVDVVAADLARLLDNLLGNAIKYGDKRIQLSCVKREQHVVISVEDNGIGIPEPDRARIFAPFQRLAQGESMIRGYGMGLAIVQKIAELHFAKIRVTQSELGGAAFQLYLPLP